MVIIELVYALPKQQQLITMEVEAGTTARGAVLQSKLDQCFPELDLHDVPIGIFGEVVKDEQLLQAGDRVELYRPLKIGPMEARRRRASR